LVIRIEKAIPPPEFFDIRLRLRTVLVKRVDDFGIGVLARIAGLGAQHGRG
jgi:hypothetical protein